MRKYYYAVTGNTKNKFSNVRVEIDMNKYSLKALNKELAMEDQWNSFSEGKGSGITESYIDWK